MLLLLLLLCLLNDHTRLVDLADLNQVLIPLENDFLYLRLLLLLMSDALLRLLVDTFLPNKDSWGALIDIAVFLWSLISALQKALPTSNIIWDVRGRTLSLKIILEVLLEGGSVVQLNYSDKTSILPYSGISRWQASKIYVCLALHYQPHPEAGIDSYVSKKLLRPSWST